MDVCVCNQIVLSISHSTVSLIYWVTFLALLRQSSSQKCFADTSSNLLSDRIVVMYSETELIALKTKQLISGEIFLPSRKNKPGFLIVCIRISHFYKPILDICVLVSCEDFHLLLTVWSKLMPKSASNKPLIDVNTWIPNAILNFVFEDRMVESQLLVNLNFAKKTSDQILVIFSIMGTNQIFKTWPSFH